MGVIVAKLYDLASNELADISTIALEKQMTPLHNGTRQFTIQAVASDPLLTSLAPDGYPNLSVGDRKLLVWEDGGIIYHGRVVMTDRLGDGTTNKVTITAADAFIELGFDPDRAGRPVRALKTDGGFAAPTFTPSVVNTPSTAISGPDLIQQILTNSIQTGAESDPTPGEGPLPIDLTTGTFDLAVPPAVDLSCEEYMSWPAMIGDFITMLVQTGVCDIYLRPIDPSEAIAIADPYLMVALSAVSRWGTDRSGTVHFDYWTGSKNASGARVIQDFATVCNKLYDLMGPAQNALSTRWKADLTPTLAGGPLAAAIAASRARFGGPGGGQFMSIREFDIAGDGSGAMVLNLALWAAAQTYRLRSRDLLYITPAPDVEGLFTAPQDFDIGDTISINIGSALGVTLADTQIVFGYTKTWNREGVSSLSELLTSADVPI